MSTNNMYVADVCYTRNNQGDAQKVVFVLFSTEQNHRLQGNNHHYKASKHLVNRGVDHNQWDENASACNKIEGSGYCQPGWMNVSTDGLLLFFRLADLGSARKSCLDMIKSKADELTQEHESGL